MASRPEGAVATATVTGAISSASAAGAGALSGYAESHQQSLNLAWVVN
jgi:hypothetical protein